VDVYVTARNAGGGGGEPRLRVSVLVSLGVGGGAGAAHGDADRGPGDAAHGETHQSAWGARALWRECSRSRRARGWHPRWQIQISTFARTDE